MIIGLVVILGAVVGLISYAFYGSGYGLWWDILLGTAGSVMASSVMVAAYVLNLSVRADDIGFTWYNVAIEVAGACALIYGGLLFKKINFIAKIEKLLLLRRMRAA